MNAASKDFPLISIVTPSFNQGEFLEECIDSILGQNYPNLEYVIMDGGSADNSVEIIKKYEKYLRYWQSKPDGGQYAAINEGFKKTSGEIMTWLNSDDMYHDDSLFTVAYLFSTHENVGWLTGRPTHWNKDGELLAVEDLSTYCRSDFLLKNYNNPFIQQESTFWRRSLWEQAGGYVDESLGYAGDLELWVRFFRHAELYSVDALLGGYRYHGNQKAVLAMDRYVAEAEEVLEEENKRVATEGSPRINPAPEPITITFKDVAAHFKANASWVPCPLGSSHQLFEYYRQKLTDANAERAALQRHIDAIESSRSWRAMRFVLRGLGMLK